MSIKLPDKSKLAERREKQVAEKEAALSKQDLVKPVTLDYLRSQADQLDKMAASLALEAASTNDPDAWDTSRFVRGQAAMCRDLIQYMKGLTHKEYVYQLREGKL